MVSKQINQEVGHSAKAKTTNLSISTKHCVEISRFLRYKTTSFAKEYLQDVIDLKKAIPFKKFNRDTGHKVGSMAAGRYPQKAAKEFLKLVGSVEANAQSKGLNISNLKISKLIPNKASIPMTGGRHRSATKRTHLEIEVIEANNQKSKTSDSKKKVKSQSEIKVQPKVEEKKVVEEKVTEIKADEINPEVKQEVPVVKVEKKEEVKSEIKADEIKPEVKQEVPVVKVEKKEEVKSEVKVEESKPEVKKETSVEKEIVEEKKVEKKEELVKELSSEDLLKKAQEVAAELNKKEEKSKDVNEVSNLYEQLQKKGTLREGEGQ
jgi:large subunit ribosomal protein L22